MAPAAISASPAVTMMLVFDTAAESPAASANGTVRPSAIPITTSRTDSDAAKCFSMWGVVGMVVAVKGRSRAKLPVSGRPRQLILCPLPAVDHGPHKIFSMCDARETDPHNVERHKRQGQVRKRAMQIANHSFRPP